MPSPSITPIFYPVVPHTVISFSTYVMLARDLFAALSTSEIRLSLRQSLWKSPFFKGVVCFLICTQFCLNRTKSVENSDKTPLTTLSLLFCSFLRAEFHKTDQSSTTLKVNIQYQMQPRTTKKYESLRQKWSSLHRLAQNLPVLTGIMRRSSMSNISPVCQEGWKIQEEIHLRQQVKCNCQWADSQSPG